MADAEEDAYHPSAQNVGETDPSDETQDFRFLNIISDTTNAPTIPKRGEKDFEPHGTAHQEQILTASRQAMHDALSHPRIHTPKSHIVGHYQPDTHQTRIDAPKGPLFKGLGKADRWGKMWLLPEETLYLVERGNLDLRWPSEDDLWEGDGMPMSLQGAYACLIGVDGLSLERYTVYAGLKRSGYQVLRAETWDRGGNLDRQTTQMLSVAGAKEQRYWGLGLFAQIFRSLFRSNHVGQLALGPLVTPGLYRSYNDIYRLLQMIPFHDPTVPSTNSSSSTTSPNFRITYLVYKPSPTFKKSAPGSPDFRIAVINARETSFPTLAEMSALLEGTPYNPPPETMKNQIYQRLRHGYRNCVMAVVDQGVTSYLRVGEAAFGKEKLHERLSGRGGGKRGGRRGGSRGGKGGRGRGRGG
ncbi:MAG: tRNA-splicing endonuclease subunit sen54 [Pycnora praestabilis]|nr:MAG: tRNA-splicing endonuclease subunit sen54 [Pycnora praestabilis]